MIFVRSCLFIIFFALLTLIMGLGSLPLRFCARRLALPYAKCWTRTGLAGLKSICGIDVAISGTENLTGESPAIIASQHQSAFDTLIWMNLVPRPAYVMKRELLKIPFVGAMLLRSGMIPVERGGGFKAIRALLKETTHAKNDGRQIIIFPEGTRTQPGEIVPLRSGIQAMASHSKLPVIPVATNSGLYWGSNILSLKPGTIRIAIGKALNSDSPRETLTSDIRLSWQALIDLERFPTRPGDPVDNSVRTSEAGAHTE